MLDVSFIQVRGQWSHKRLSLFSLQAMFIRSYLKSPLNMQTKKFIGLQQCTLNIPNTNTKVFISISSDSKNMYFDIDVFENHT